MRLKELFCFFIENRSSLLLPLVVMPPLVASVRWFDNFSGCLQLTLCANECFSRNHPSFLTTCRCCWWRNYVEITHNVLVFMLVSIKLVIVATIINGLSIALDVVADLSPLSVITTLSFTNQWSVCIIFLNNLVLDIVEEVEEFLVFLIITRLR